MNFEMLNMEPKNYSTTTPATPIDWRYCPRKLQLWLEFPKIHDERFHALGQLFGDDRLFLPYDGVRGCQFYLENMDIEDEASCATFCYLATEIPVKRIFGHYLERKPCGVKEILVKNRSACGYSYMDQVEETCLGDAADTFPKDREAGLPDADSLIDKTTPNVVIEEPEDIERGPSLLLVVLPPDVSSVSANKENAATGDEAHDHQQAQSGTGPELTRKRAASSLPSIDCPLPVRVRASDGRVTLDTLCADNEPSETTKNLALIEYKTPQIFTPSVLRRVLDKGRGANESIFAHYKESKMIEYFSWKSQIS
ncbi:uncharacterized protein BROUX77_005958 [Berkeleyomyces rouxiae]|uniref:uncharacterized protein n=1 Tax=Berkeleyomyces rouxiae TaxID=2035830 RepID=UPI003B7D96BA